MAETVSLNTTTRTGRDNLQSFRTGKEEARRPQGEKAEYMFGVVLVRFERDPRVLMRFAEGHLKASPTLLEKVANLLENAGRCVAYITAIGVIDEGRRLGVGSKLMQLALAHAQLLRPECVGLSLHVLETNQGAVTFYEKNHFVHLVTIPGCYTIFGEHFKGRFYAKPCSAPPSRVHTFVTAANIVVHLLRIALYHLIDTPY